MKSIIQDIIVDKKNIDKKSETTQKKDDFFRNYRRDSAAKETLNTKEFSKEHKNSEIQKRASCFRFSKAKIVFVILILILFGIIGVKTINTFSRVTVFIKPHEEMMKIDAVFKAGQNGSADLTFEVMELELNKEKSVDATGIENVETKANGQIVIYNIYSSAAQLLVQNTRFESPTGKIYRLDKAVTVPGTKTQNGKTIPGSIEATIYADKPGEEYNSDPTDLTIPGFKDGPRYDKFYARSKTPLTGGFKGSIPIIADGDYNKIKEDLRKVLKEELLGRARTQKPADFILFEKAAKIAFTELETNQTSGRFTLRIDGVFSAPLVSKKGLTEVLVKKYIGDDAKDKVNIGNIESLEFEITGMDETTFILKIKGNARFIWLLEEEKLKEALIASSKDIGAAFKSYPAVEGASIMFEPSWWKFFPTEKSRITVRQTL